MQLSEMQKQFTALLFDAPDAVDSPPAEFAALFAKSEIPLSEQLKVYRNHVVISLSEAIAVTFPLVEKLAGGEFLRDAAKHYLREQPPTESCLDRYGATFADFLSGSKQAGAYPFLADAARLDWAINESKCAKNDATLKPDDLAHIPQDKYGDAIFILKDCVKLIHSPYPLHKIYDYEEDSGEDLIIENEETFLMVTRVGLDVKILKLEPDEFLMFQKLRDRQALEMALEFVLTQHPDFDFAHFLKNYVALETFSAFSTN